MRQTSCLLSSARRVAASVVMVILLCCSGLAMAQPPRAVVAAGARLFPVVAAPGEQVWLIGTSGRLDAAPVLVGSRPTRLSRDPVSGWLTFVVPPDAASGPQVVSTQQTPTPPALILTVLPRELNLQEVVASVNPAAATAGQQEDVLRLQRLAQVCARACPGAVMSTIQRLIALGPPTLNPLNVTIRDRQGLASPRLPLSSVRADPASSVVRPPFGTVDLGRLPAPLADTSIISARKNSFCGQLAGLLPSDGLPTGLVQALLNLLFPGDLSIDPSTFGFPSQAIISFRNEKPRTVLEQVLGITSGAGTGVTIHILDTADQSGDDFVLRRRPGEPEPFYYDVPLDGRPLHGRVVGEVAKAVAPLAQVQFYKVCSGDGLCRTLDTVQALCAVAQEARQGGRHVVNLSAGGPYPAVGLKLALAEVAGLGVPTATSYGNRDDCVGHAPGDQCRHYPADWSPEFVTSTAPKAPTLLISVAGRDINPDVEEYATYNRAVAIPWAQTPLPGVQAPGEFWFAGMPYFGTSFAAPVVSGMLAGWMSCRPGVPFLPLVTAPHQNPLASVVNACP